MSWQQKVYNVCLGQAGCGKCLPHQPPHLNECLMSRLTEGTSFRLLCRASAGPIHPSLPPRPENGNKESVYSFTYTAHSAMAKVIVSYPKNGAACFSLLTLAYKNTSGWELEGNTKAKTTPKRSGFCFWLGHRLQGGGTGRASLCYKGKRGFFQHQVGSEFSSLWFSWQTSGSGLKPPVHLLPKPKENRGLSAWPFSHHFCLSQVVVAWHSQVAPSHKEFLLPSYWILHFWG